MVDIIQVLIQQPDYQTARKYWNKLKERLKKEGSESVTNCHQLKMEAQDGKKYLTDAADPETLLRLIQSVPSPKASILSARQDNSPGKMNRILVSVLKPVPPRHQILPVGTRFIASESLPMRHAYFQ